MEKTFRVVSLFEGVSYLLLLFIATPVKYFGGDESYVKMLGMPHGILFIAYVVIAIMLKYQFEWESKKFWIILAASIIPFGTFYIDRKYFKN